MRRYSWFACIWAAGLMNWAWAADAAPPAAVPVNPPIAAAPAPVPAPPVAPPAAINNTAPADGAVCGQLLRVTPTVDGEKRPRRRAMFNSRGTLCAVDHPLRQGEHVQAFLVMRAGEDKPDQLPKVSTTNCTVPTGGVIVLGTLPPGIVNQAGVVGAPGALKLQQDTAYEIGEPIECASSEVTVSLQAGTGAAVETKLKFFEVVTAVLHVGVMNSKLREPAFGLKTVAGDSVITNTEATERGPEYVASIVVQGLPNYFSRGFGYPGRDLVHDYDWKDRLGLAFNFGLKEPAKRFGMGLAFEVVRGVNVMAVHEWLKQSRLEGVALGDTFTGDAASIPTRRTWAKGWSFGVSFDSAYLTGIFKSSK